MLGHGVGGGRRPEQSPQLIDPWEDQAGQVFEQGGALARLGWGFRNSGCTDRVVGGTGGPHGVEVKG